MFSISLPIYYTQEFKTKDDKVWLVGDNAFRNWHYHLKNDVKQHYHDLVKEQLEGAEAIDGPFKVEIVLYYKNVNSDPSNIISRMEKFSLDPLQELGLIKNDNMKFHHGTSWGEPIKDRDNPRCEIVVFSAN